MSPYFLQYANGFLVSVTNKNPHHADEGFWVATFFEQLYYFDPASFIVTGTILTFRGFLSCSSCG